MQRNHMHNAVAAIQDAVKDAFVKNNIAKISDGGNDVTVALVAPKFS